MSEVIASVPGLDVEPVTEWLLANVRGLAPPLSFTRVGEGQSNLTFRVDDAAGATIVLRRPPLGEILASAHDVAREYRILAALASVGARAPRPIALCDDLEVTGAPFYAMEFVPGDTLVTLDAAERLSPEARNEVGLT